MPLTAGEKEHTEIVNSIGLCVLMREKVIVELVLH